MAAGKLDLAIEQGATFRRQLLWRQPSPDGGVTPGDPYPLTGCSAHMQVRDKTGGNILLELHDTDGLVLGGDAGTIELTFTQEQTASLRVRRAVYDLYVIYANGDAVRVVEGVITIDLTVTDPVPYTAPSP